MTEKLDLVNDLNEPTGEVMAKRDVHRLGRWHRTFSALAVAPRRRAVLLQVKADNRIPGGPPPVPIADFTVGGHPREIHEETGLTIAYDTLFFLGIRQTAATLPNGRIEREFQYWHLIPLEHQLRDIPLNDDEVTGLVELDIDAAISLADFTIPEVTAQWSRRGPHGIDITKGPLTTDNLVPNYLRTDLDRIYLRTFVAARRYCNGERDHLFW